MGAGYILVGLSRIFFFASSFFLPVDEITRFSISFLPPVALAIIFISVEIGGGLVGNLVDESVREWFARRAWASFGFAWLGVGLRCSVPALRSLQHGLSRQAPCPRLDGHYAGQCSGRKSSFWRDIGRQNSPLPVAQHLALIGPPIFMVGLTSFCLLSSRKILTALETSSAASAAPEFFWLLLILALTAALFGWRIDINEFSLHSFYRDRLARCYAGADPAAGQPLLVFPLR
jgi:hypothetical protein